MGCSDVYGIGFAIAPSAEVEWGAGFVEAFADGGGEEFVPCGVAGGEPAGGSVHHEPLFGVGFFAPVVELGGVAGVGAEVRS